MKINYNINQLIINFSFRKRVIILTMDTEKPADIGPNFLYTGPSETNLESVSKSSHKIKVAPPSDQPIKLNPQGEKIVLPKELADIQEKPNQPKISEREVFLQNRIEKNEEIIKQQRDEIAKLQQHQTVLMKESLIKIPVQVSPEAKEQLRKMFNDIIGLNPSLLTKEQTIAAVKAHLKTSYPDIQKPSVTPSHPIEKIPSKVETPPGLRRPSQAAEATKPPSPILEKTPQQAESSKETEYKFDVTSEADDYVRKLDQLLQSTDTQTLSKMLGRAAEQGSFFIGEDKKYGFQLPAHIQIEKKGIAISTHDSFISNVALELWFRRLQTALTIEGKAELGTNTFGLMSDKDLETKKRDELKLVEKMSDLLFNPEAIYGKFINKNGVIEDIMETINREGGNVYEGNDMLRSGDKKIIEEIILNKATFLGEGEIQHIGASQSRINLILRGVRRAMAQPHFRLRIDASIAGNNTGETIDLTTNPSLRKSWKENLKKIARLDEEWIDTYETNQKQ